MLFFMCYTLASSGEPYLVTFRPGKRFIATSAGLEMPDGGKSLTTISPRNTGYVRVGRLTQVQPVLIARVLKPAKPAHITVSTLAKRLKVVNAIYWLTPKAYWSQP